MSDFHSNGSSDRALEAYDQARKYAEPTREFSFGPAKTADFLSDPKRTCFSYSRYKFVSKMLSGSKNVLEVGCQEGSGTVFVAAEVESVVAIDFYKPYIDVCLSHVAPMVSNIQFMGHDIIGGPVEGRFDGAYALDVLEHIDPAQEDLFMRNILKSLTERGTFVVGIPSLESQAYASEASRKGHINCKSGKDLKAFCAKYFHNVFMFGMNDEVLHTGFFPMCHYLFAMCVGRR